MPLLANDLQYFIWVFLKRMLALEGEPTFWNTLKKKTARHAMISVETNQFYLAAIRNPSRPLIPSHGHLVHSGTIHPQVDGNPFFPQKTET